VSEAKTALEVLFGSLITEAAGTVLAMHTPLAALLPVLTNSFAAHRFEKRIEATLVEINAELQTLRDKVDKFSDAQFRLTVGIVKTIVETIDDEKLRLLKAAVLNVARSDHLESFEAQLFTRILRDISAAEIAFLAKHRNVSWFSFASPRDADSTFYINSATLDGTLARGLINLGLLVRAPSEGLMSDAGGYSVAPFAVKLLELIVGGGAAPIGTAPADAETR